jgi:hypothetical protein
MVANVLPRSKGYAAHFSCGTRLSVVPNEPPATDPDRVRAEHVDELKGLEAQAVFMSAVPPAGIRFR